MKVAVECANRKEAEAIRIAMADDEVHAFVLIVGTLLPFTGRARARILHFIADEVNDPNNAMRSTGDSDANS